MNLHDLEFLARALGGAKAQRTGSGWLTLCPAHDNTRTPSLSLNLGDEGRLLVKCHGGNCSGGDILDILRSRGLIEGRSSRRESAPKISPKDREAERLRALKLKNQRIESALRIWGAARPAMGTPVEHYLKVVRGIDIRSMPKVIRYHPNLRHPSKVELPAMIALVQRVTGESLGIHRTYLKPDGSGKADVEPSKAMLGPCAGGGVWFGSPRERWSVGEGIESSLSFASATHLPVCATLSTSGMAGLDLPACPKAGGVLIVASDGDEPGRNAAAVLVERARLIGWKSERAIPPDNMDFNDLLLKQEGGSKP